MTRPIGRTFWHLKVVSSPRRGLYHLFLVKRGSMAKRGGDIAVTIPKIEVERVTVPIESLPPGLLTHRFGEDKRRQMAEAQQGKVRSRVGRQPKDPEKEFHNSIYFIGNPNARNKRYGIPAISFKQAMVNGCRVIKALSMAEARQMFFVLGCEDDREHVEIDSEFDPVMREDPVRNASGVADLRYRAFWPEWTADLHVEFLAGTLTTEQVVNLINVAGWSSGVCEMRPQQKIGGTFGRFQVALKKNTSNA